MEQNSLICREMDVVSSETPVQSRTALAQRVGGAPESQPPKGKGRVAVLWGLSGTVLSAVGFIALALFEQYNSSLNELQRDLKHFNEMSADFVKKESMQRCYEHIKNCFKELHEAGVVRAQLERELAASDRDRRELGRELQLVRERLASVEGRQAVTTLVLPMAHANQ